MKFSASIIAATLAIAAPLSASGKLDAAFVSPYCADVLVREVDMNVANCGRRPQLWFFYGSFIKETD